MVSLPIGYVQNNKEKKKGKEKGAGHPLFGRRKGKKQKENRKKWKRFWQKGRKRK